MEEEEISRALAHLYPSLSHTPVESDALVVVGLPPRDFSRSVALGSVVDFYVTSKRNMVQLLAGRLSRWSLETRRCTIKFFFLIK